MTRLGLEQGGGRAGLVCWPPLFLGTVLLSHHGLWGRNRVRGWSELHLYSSDPLTAQPPLGAGENFLAVAYAFGEGSVQGPLISLIC